MSCSEQKNETGIQQIQTHSFAGESNEPSTLIEKKVLPHRKAAPKNIDWQKAMRESGLDKEDESEDEDFEPEETNDSSEDEFCESDDE